MSEQTQQTQPQESQSIVQNLDPQPPAPVPFKVYKPTDTITRVPPPLPDEYFEPTAEDVRAAQATLTARTQALVNAPLQLKSAREATEKARRERWPLTRIRVRFPDRTQLERVFPSTDKIKSVYAFVRELLRDDVKPVKFILYQSPPKRDFKVSDPKVRGLSLVELELAPSSVLLLRFEEDHLNHVHVTAPLLPEILAQAVDLPIPVDSEGPTQAPSATSSLSVPKLLGEKKIPKWLKLGKK